ncbi:hypothetical protein REPUB_Repub12eG0063400 [Reevesia pubescens]
MVEGTRLTTLQDQVQTLQSHVEAMQEANSSIPHWWEEQKKGIDSQFTKNQKNITIILDLVAPKDNVHAPLESSTSASIINNLIILGSSSKAQGKSHVEVIVIDDHGRYVYNHDDPGILPKKPYPYVFNLEGPRLLPKKPIDIRGWNLVTNQQFTRNLDPSTNPNSIQTMASYTLMPKIELQAFDGTNPRGWIRKW